MRTAIAIAALLAGSAVAQADHDPARAIEVKPDPQAIVSGVHYLYINRCVGGCTVKKGGDDARTLSSDVPNSDLGGTLYTLSDFSAGEDDWNAIMKCMKEAYSPFDIVVSDQPPPPATPYNEGVVAGSQRQFGLTMYGGYAAINTDCTPRAYAISFSFANDYGSNPLEVCAVAAQETAHSFGLRHSYEFLDGRSAGPDPMTYRNYSGQRFFRNEPARCGEYEPGSCGACGQTQNTHQQLLNAIGKGTPITAAPTLTVTTPLPGAAIANGTSVVASSGAPRGVAKIEVILNGYNWATLDNNSYSPVERSFAIAIPPEVPDGVIDIVVRAKDDIEVTTESPVITVTKGAPCVSADTCAAGQRCLAGKCFWDAPSGVLGDECTFKQFCQTELCQSIDTGESRCTQGCVLGIEGNCPVGFECLGTSDQGGVCWPSSDVKTGCTCSTSSRDFSVQSGLLAFGLGVLFVRRRRRSA